MPKSRRVYIQSIAILLILTMGCSNDSEFSNDRSSDTNIAFEKVDEFSISDQDVTLDRVKNLVVANHNDSLLAWISNGKNEIILTDSRGNLVSKFGKKGRGSEEFSNISAFGFDGNNHLIVYDSGQDFFKKFSVNGELLWIEKGLLKDGLWTRSNRIISYNNHMYLGIQESGVDIDWKSRTIAMYNGDGQLSSTFGVYDPDLRGGKNRELYVYSNSISLDPAGSKIFTTHRTSPYIQTFDANTGERISRFGFLSDHFKISNDKPDISDPRPIKNKKNLKQSAVGESFVSNTYFFFHHFNWTEEFWQTRDPNAKPHFLNVFQKDKPHAFLGEISLPYMPLYISSNNKAYLLENDDPDNFTIGVYEVVKN